MALGRTWSLPEDDRYQVTREELLAQITMALGGRLSEEIEFGDVTTGASNDFEKATELRGGLVTQYGMSELGPIQYGRGAHQLLVGATSATSETTPKKSPVRSTHKSANHRVGLRKRQRDPQEKPG